MNFRFVGIHEISSQYKKKETHPYIGKHVKVIYEDFQKR